MSADHLSRDLKSILTSFIDLLECDGGSIFTVAKSGHGESKLVFRAMITQSVEITEVPEALKHMAFAIDDTTLVGRTGLNRFVYEESYLESEASGPKSVTDDLIHYETKSILSAPLVTPRGDLVGVVQLVNKAPDSEGKERSFGDRDARLCGIVSQQAALSIENSMLLHEQEKILDGFVNACVTAIETRDPVTSGHSQRVCDLTLGLADAVNKTRSGSLAFVSFSDTQIREIRYAAMLHDIGKISVKEQILNKEKKLFPWELELIDMRLKMMKTAIRAEFKGKEEQIELHRQLREIERAWAMIQAANEPTVLPQEVSQGIIELTKLEVHVEDHSTCCALTPEESEKLRIARGSLTKAERIEIERHVAFTYEILKMVPWSRGLEHVPLIAHRHHEKLDGTGYPLGKQADQIPMQSRMLTICDIYDALTAKDRPYKASVPVEKAIAILEDEVRQGKLDHVLCQLFVEAKVFMIPQHKVKKSA